MAKIYISGGAINIEDVYPDIISINKNQFDWDVRNDIYYARDKIQNQEYKLGIFSDIEDRAGIAYTSDFDVIFALNQLINENLGTPPILITQMARLIAATTLTTQAEIGDTSIDVADASLVVVGSYIVIFNTATNRFYQGKAISKNVNTINLDSPIDSVLDIANSEVSIGDSNMAVDGSTTPIDFSFRADQLNPVNLQINIRRIIITMQLTSGGNLSLFGNITKLTKGLLFRQLGGIEYNIFNVKDNREIRNLGYDLVFDTTQGSSPDGVSARITFSRMGGDLAVPPGGNIIAKVQDDLQAITKLEITCEGYVLT